MLIRSDTRYVPTAVNMIVLQGEDGAYYYLHRSLYDQCVILRDQYIGLIPSFYKLLGFEGEHPKVCDTFMESVPEPLDILPPSLASLRTVRSWTTSMTCAVPSPLCPCPWTSGRCSRCRQPFAPLSSSA